MLALQEVLIRDMWMQMWSTY